jgi:hypothetical protein
LKSSLFDAPGSGSAGCLLLPSGKDLRQPSTIFNLFVTGGCPHLPVKAAYMDMCHAPENNASGRCFHLPPMRF